MEKFKSKIRFTLFLVLITISLFCFIKSMGKNVFLLNVENFAPIYNTVSISVETDKNKNKDLAFLIDDKIVKPVWQGSFAKIIIANQKISKIAILKQKDTPFETKGIFLFNDYKTNYFDDLFEFDKSEENLCIENNCKDYNVYQFPSKIKFFNPAQSINFHSVLNCFAVCFLSVFVNYNFFVIPLLLLALAFLIYTPKCLNSQKNLYVIFGFIIILAFFLRYNCLFDNYLVYDDQFAFIHGLPTSPIKYLFNDWGNPPLIFILVKLWMILFGVSFKIAKLLPLFLGLLGVITTFFVMRKEFGLKTAVWLCFLTATDIQYIRNSQIIRPYVLFSILTPLIIYALFRYLKKQDFKGSFLYLLTTTLLLNTHYWGWMIVCANALYGTLDLINGKKYKQILNFIIIHLLAALTLIPFFINGVIFAYLNTSFNNHNSPMTLEHVRYCTYTTFGGGFGVCFLISFFILFAILSLIKTKDIFEDEISKKQIKVIVYCFFVMLISLMGSFLAPFLITSSRTILTPLYLTTIYGFLVVAIGLGMTLKGMPKIMSLIFLAGFIAMQCNWKDSSAFRHQRAIPTLEIAYYDSHNYKDKEIYVGNQRMNEEFKASMIDKEYLQKHNITYIYDMDFWEKIWNKVKNKNHYVIYLQLHKYDDRITNPQSGKLFQDFFTTILDKDQRIYRIVK